MSKVTSAVGGGINQENPQTGDFEQKRLEWLASRKERSIEQIAPGELGELARRTLDVADLEDESKSLLRQILAYQSDLQPETTPLLLTLILLHRG